MKSHKTAATYLRLHLPLPKGDICATSAAPVGISLLIAQISPYGKVCVCACVNASSGIYVFLHYFLFI